MSTPHAVQALIDAGHLVEVEPGLYRRSFPDRLPSRRAVHTETSTSPAQCVGHCGGMDGTGSGVSCRGDLPSVEPVDRPATNHSADTLADVIREWVYGSVEPYDATGPEFR